MWEQTWENLSAEKIMALIEAGKYDEPPGTEILIVPNDVKLTELTGDDWNDTPASCNASGVHAPKGWFVGFTVGEPIPDYVADALIRWAKEKEV